jgi:hypothetical protein
VNNEIRKEWMSSVGDRVRSLGGWLTKVVEENRIREELAPVVECTTEQRAFLAPARERLPGVG